MTPAQWVAKAQADVASLNRTFDNEVRPALLAEHAGSSRVPRRVEALMRSLQAASVDLFSLALALDLDPEDSLS